MGFDLTAEQLAAIEHATTSPANLIIEARAGAAKTTTLVEIAKRLPGPVLSLAFNASIRDEMKLRMPDHVECLTLHGCGFAAWRRYLPGIKMKVDEKKTSSIFREVIAGLPKRDQDDAWASYADILRAVSVAKNQGVLFNAASPQFKPLVSAEEFFDSYVVELSEFEKGLVAEVSARSWTACTQGRLDFDDMVLAPAVAGVTFPFYKTVLVDEAQDLSHLNHVLLRKLTRSPRTKLIACGDPFQAIYGFRGADTQSLANLRRLYDAETCYLTTTFRCAISIVEAAKWRASDLKWASWAKPGLVLSPPSWSTEDIPDDAAIICRNNAPLYTMAMRLITADRSCELAGRDITENIVKELKGLQPKKQPPLSRDSALLAIDAWEESKKRRIKDQRLVEDQAECLRIFVNRADDLDGAIALASALANQKGRIKLMTGHKSKGLEFPTVFILDQQLLRLDKNEQDANLKYVMITRAKENLVFVTSDTFMLPEDEAPEAEDDLE
jgi:DNA helicase-2/ATP-dependent DNA helicase PcrA